MKKLSKGKIMLIFENEELQDYLVNEDIGYGDKLEKLVELLGNDKRSLINRIKSKKFFS